MNSRFDFMADKFPELALLGKKAEECLYYDYNLCLLNLGRLAEKIINLICRHYNINNNINELAKRKIISENITCKINTLLEIKQDASDKDYNSQTACRRLMDTASELCTWFLDEYGHSKFDFLGDLFHPSEGSFPLNIIAEAGREAEKNLYSNPRYCLICIGDMGEIMLDIMITKFNLAAPEKIMDKIELLYKKKYLKRSQSDILHDIRMIRNKAVHFRYDSESDCKRLLCDVMPLCEWVFNASLSPGDIIRGVVTSINQDSLTISIGELTGIVQSSEIPDNEWANYSKGQDVIFSVIRSSPDDGKIYLGMNNTYNNPWEKSRLTQKSESEYRLSDSEFFKLCRTGSNYEIIREINNGANVNYTDSSGVTVLMCLVERCLSPELIKLVLSKCSNVNSADNKGNTALILAAVNCGEDVVIMLLDNKADKNARNNNGKRAYNYAKGNAKLKNSQVIKLLKPEGVKDSGKKKSAIAKKKIHTDKAKASSGEVLDVKPLIAVSEDGTAKIIESHAKDTKTAPDYETLLLICREKTSDDLKEALNAGGIIDFSHLIAACEHNTLDVIKILLDKLHSKKRSDKNNNTLLMIALEKDNKNPGVIETLIDTSDDLNAQNNTGRTALITACEKNNIEAVKLLLERKVNVNIRNNMGNTALIIASGRNYQEIAELLISSGADVNIKNNEGSTALDFAMKNMKGSEFVKAMLRQKFLTLCKTGSPDKIKQALEAGISANSRNKAGNTALIYAACYNSPEAVNILLDYGADPSIKNASGARALNYARRNIKLADSEALKRLENF